MSIYTEGELVYLVAVSKADYIIKKQVYEAKGYVEVLHSHNTTGYVHKWRMQLTEDAELVTVEELEESVAASSDGVSTESTTSISENSTSDSSDIEEEVDNTPTEAEPVTASFTSDPNPDFLPDWDKVEEFMKMEDEKAAKLALDEYAETFGVNLNRRRSLVNMKADFIESCSK